MEKDLSFLKENLIAHRGYHDISLGIPENSIPAFKRAIDNNYIIELDVHILKDGKVVVFHDDNLKRMTGESRKIKDCFYDEICNLKLLNTNEQIPLFSDVLKLVDGKVPIIIELKYDVEDHSLEKKVMDLLEGYNGKYVVKSFDPFIVKYFKDNYPEVIRGQLSSDFKHSKMNILKKLMLKNMVFNMITEPDFISYDIRAIPNKKIEVLRKDHLILAWTIKSKEELEKARKYCDNYICENIEKII